MTDLESQPDVRADLLWFDGFGGLGAGVLVLAVSGWLAPLYGLPLDIVRFIAAANLPYGTCGTLLASAPRRAPWAIAALAIANMSWPLVCVGVAAAYAPVVSRLGLAHLGLEAVYVGALGLVEWRWRHRMVVRRR